MIIPCPASAMWRRNTYTGEPELVIMSAYGMDSETGCYVPPGSGIAHIALTKEQANRMAEFIRRGQTKREELETL
jgi:hypothetical protein